MPVWDQKGHSKDDYKILGPIYAGNGEFSVSLRDFRLSPELINLSLEVWFYNCLEFCAGLLLYLYFEGFVSWILFVNND